MKKLVQTLLVCLLALVSAHTIAQNKETFVGKWKVDYEATKTICVPEDKMKEYTENTEKMFKPMLMDMGLEFGKDGKCYTTIKGEVTSKRQATWSVKGKELTIKGDNVKVFEIKEATKTKLVLYDKTKVGFSTLVFVPNE